MLATEEYKITIRKNHQSPWDNFEESAVISFTEEEFEEFKKYLSKLHKDGNERYRQNFYKQSQELQARILRRSCFTEEQIQERVYN